MHQHQAEVTLAVSACTQPFNLRSEQRHAQAPARQAAELEEQHKQEEEQRRFKATQLDRTIVSPPPLLPLCTLPTTWLSPARNACATPLNT